MHTPYFTRSFYQGITLVSIPHATGDGSLLHSEDDDRSDVIRVAKKAAEDMVTGTADRAPRRPAHREAANAAERIPKEQGVPDLRAPGKPNAASSAGIRAEGALPSPGSTAWPASAGRSDQGSECNREPSPVAYYLFVLSALQRMHWTPAGQWLH